VRDLAGAGVRGDADAEPVASGRARADPHPQALVHVRRGHHAHAFRRHAIAELGGDVALHVTQGRPHAAGGRDRLDAALDRERHRARRAVDRQRVGHGVIAARHRGVVERGRRHADRPEHLGLHRGGVRLGERALGRERVRRDEPAGPAPRAAPRRSRVDHASVSRRSGAAARRAGRASAAWAGGAAPSRRARRRGSRPPRSRACGSRSTTGRRR